MHALHKQDLCVALSTAICVIVISSPWVCSSGGGSRDLAVQPHPELQILGKMLSRHKVCVLLARFDLSRSSRFDFAAPTLAEP